MSGGARKRSHAEALLSNSFGDEEKSPALEVKKSVSITFRYINTLYKNYCEGLLFKYF